MWLNIMIVGLAMMLASCNTPYQELKWNGGVSAQPVATNIYRVVARGNGYTNSSTIQDYVLLKSAETTLMKGGTHFAILGVEDATSKSWYSTPTTVQTNVIGSSAHSTISPGSMHQIIKPGQSLLVRIYYMYNTKNIPSQYLDAQDIYNNISPRVRRAQKTGDS